MKALSHWASRHVWQARFLLILIGIFRGIVGVQFGFIFLKNMNITQMNVTACVLFCIIFGVETWFHHRKSAFLRAPDKLYNLRIRCLSIVYTSNFLLLMLVGNAVYRYQPAEEILTKTTFSSIVSFKNAPSVNWTKKEEVTKKLYFFLEKIKLKWQQRLTKNEDRVDITLFLIIGIFLSFASLPFLLAGACAISCGSTETVFILYLLFGLGTFIAGLFSLNYASRIFNRMKANQNREIQLKPEPSNIHEKGGNLKAKKKLARNILLGLCVVVLITLIKVFSKKS